MTRESLAVIAKRFAETSLVEYRVKCFSRRELNVCLMIRF